MVWKKKNVCTYAILFTCLLVIMVTTIRSIVVASPDTLVHLDPEEVASVTWTPGKQFTVDIDIEDVEDLYAWEVYLSWNATVLDLTNVTEGSFLKAQPGGTFFVWQRSEDIAGEPPLPEGFVIIGVTSQGEFLGQTGDGTLATVTFLIETYGDSPLDLYSTMLLDSTGYGPGEEIPHSVKDGYFVNEGVPEAAFSYSPSLPPANETLTFDASASYDTDGTIVNYAWVFGDGTSLNETDPIATHIYTNTGTYSVVLTVTDDKGLTSTKAKTIKIRYQHDVAVTFISTSPTEVEAGESVAVDVTVINKGVQVETFDVTVYCGETALSPKTATNLAANATQTLAFTWDTTGVSKGDYTIKAVASTVTGETYVTDNTWIDGDVGVTVLEQPLDMTLIIVGVVVVVAIAAVALFLLRRGKSPKAT